MAAFNVSIVAELKTKIAGAFQPRKYPLSPQQQAVVEWTCTGGGHAVVLAGPGSGKSSLLLGTLPFIAESPRDVEATTLHSYGLRAWKSAFPLRKVTVDKDKTRKILDVLYAETKDGAYVASWPFLRKIVSHAKAAGFGIAGAPAIADREAWLDLVDTYSLDMELNADENAETLISNAQAVYTRSLKECKSLVDFDDMLLAPLYFDVPFPKFDWVLGDESQDYSFIRRKLLMNAIRPVSGRSIFVGDPLQALYSFVGADSQSMSLIRDELQAVTFPLTVSYRLPKSSVKLAQAYMPELTATLDAIDGIVRGFGSGDGHLPPVHLAPKNGQPDFWKMGPFDADTAIICRNNKPLVELAYNFLRRRIPAYVEGRDIGQGLAKLAQHWKVKTLDALERKLDAWEAAERTRFLKLGREDKAADVTDKKETLAVLIQATRDAGRSGISDLVAIIGDLFGDTKEGEKPKCTVLSSVHKFKGREARRVFILGYQIYMPSKWSRRDDARQWEVEGEKCCIFVALTRSLYELAEIVVPEKEKERN